MKKINNIFENLQDWTIEELERYGSRLSDNGCVEMAVRCFETAADKGSLFSMFWLGCLFHSDLYGMQDYQKAFKYFKESADRGYLNSMFYLTVYYHEGIGTERNLKEYERWLDETVRLDPDGSKFKEMKSMFNKNEQEYA